MSPILKKYLLFFVKYHKAHSHTHQSFACACVCLCLNKEVHHFSLCFLDLSQRPQAIVIFPYESVSFCQCSSSHTMHTHNTYLYLYIYKHVIHIQIYIKKAYQRIRFLMRLCYKISKHIRINERIWYLFLKRYIVCMYTYRINKFTYTHMLCTSGLEKGERATEKK